MSKQTTIDAQAWQAISKKRSIIEFQMYIYSCKKDDQLQSSILQTRVRRWY